MSEIASIAPPNLTAPMRRGRPVTAYLKPSDYCNVGCDHCYLPLTVRANKFRMPDSTLDAAIRTIREMVDRQNAPGAIVIWHGGEPLALPQPYFEQACALVRARMPDAVQSIQTSLIPYKHSWAPMIREYMGGHIGTSIDFAQRKIKGDVQKYHDLWLEKVAMARSDGFTITPGVVPSTEEEGKGRQIVAWMLQHDFLDWNIDRYNSFGREDPMRPNNQAHSLFLTDVFDGVMELARHGTFMRVNTVQAALLGILRDAPGDRWGGSCSHDFIVINPDGSTSACPDKISFETFSNARDGYDGFAKSEARRAWIRMHMTGHRNSHCGSCQFRSFCKSGCPLTPNAPESEGECSGYHRHLQHVLAFSAQNKALVQTYLERTMQ